MTKHTRLLRRGAVYYFRCKIPVDLIDHYGTKREIIESLRTKDAKEALRLVRSRSLQQEEEFDRIRAGRTVTELTDEQIQALADEHYADLLKLDEQSREQGLSEEDYEERNAQVASWDSYLPALLARGDVKRGGYLAHLVLKWRGITQVPKNSPSHRKLTYALLKASVKANDAVRMRQQGKVVDTPKVVAPVRLNGARVGGRATLGELLPRWEREREPSPRACQEWGLVVRRFDAIHGELPVDLIEKAHVVAYKDKMLADDAAAATINKHLGAIGSLLRLAVENDLCPVNVARGIRVRGRKVPEEARLSYGIEDLQKIFSSPVYTDGLRPVGGAGEAGFWLPLLGLWAGSRLEELGQLLVQDVKRSPDGIDYFQVTDQGEGQKLKTKGSRRSVPIHPELIRLGFLRYIDERRAAGDVLVFPALRQSSHGRRTQAWSKWWGRYAREQAGITDPRKVFHSFRHTFKRQCRECDIPKDIHDAITGHRVETWRTATAEHTRCAHWPMRSRSCATRG